jgi:hypothetical protein
MRPAFILVGVFLVLVLLAFWRERTASSDTIEYLGQTIKLSKAYDDFDVYKNDPNNLAPFEIPRVQKLVSETPLPAHVHGEEEFTTKVLGIEFPGYGTTAVRSAPDATGAVLQCFAIEIPHANKDRYIVYRVAGEDHTLLDDFIESEDTPIMNVRQDGEKLIYTKSNGKVVRERPVLKSRG